MASDFDFTAVTASLITANQSTITAVQGWATADAEQLATDAGWADTTTPCVCADDDDFLFLMVNADASTVFSYSALSAPFKTSAAQAIAEVDAYSATLSVSGRETLAGLVLADDTGPDLAVASEVEFGNLLAICAPNSSVIDFGSFTVDASVLIGIQRLNTRDTAYILTEAGASDVTGPIYDVADQDEADAIVEAFFAMVKKKK